MPQIPNKSPKRREILSTALQSLCYLGAPLQAQDLLGEFVIWDLHFVIYL